MKILFNLVFLFSLSVAAQPLEGRVVRIIDGDTFTMAIEKDTVTVRLHGVDCPENKQPFSKEAEDFLSIMILGKQVQIEKKGNDKYRRIIAIVTLDTINLNEAFLKAGLAWHFKKYDKNIKWAKLEEEARVGKMGLWRITDPVPPWEWRRKK